jgi:hypothetical protein
VLLKGNAKTNDVARVPSIRNRAAFLLGAQATFSLCRLPADATLLERRRRYALLPRTTAKGSGFAQGTNFVTENQAPAAFVLSWTLMRSPRTLMNCSMSREAGALSVQLPSAVSVTSPGENALSARAPAPCT